MRDGMEQMRTSTGKSQKTLLYREGVEFDVPLKQAAQHVFIHLTEQAFDGMGLAEKVLQGIIGKCVQATVR